MESVVHCKVSMNKLLAVLFLFVSLSISAAAIDLNGLEAIGAVSGFTKDANSVTFACADGSQLRVYVLASDVLRVRAAFKQPFPAIDYSWAIAKTEWAAPRWEVRETPEAVIISTDEVETVVQRTPLLISFRDKKTGRVINADAQPMMYDAKGVMKSRLFDADAGPYIASVKKFGFDENFYGLGEKASRLNKRRAAILVAHPNLMVAFRGRKPI